MCACQGKESFVRVKLRVQDAWRITLPQIPLPRCRVITHYYLALIGLTLRKEPR